MYEGPLQRAGGNDAEPAETEAGLYSSLGWGFTA